MIVQSMNHTKCSYAIRVHGHLGIFDFIVAGGANTPTKALIRVRV